MLLLYASYVTVVGVGRCIYVKITDIKYAEFLILERERLAENGLKLPDNHPFFQIDVDNLSPRQKTKYLVRLIKAIKRDETKINSDEEIVAEKEEDIEKEEVEADEELKKKVLDAIIAVMDVEFLSKTGFLVEADSSIVNQQESGVHQQLDEKEFNWSDDDDSSSTEEENSSGEEYLLKSINRSNNEMDGELVDLDRMYDHYLERMENQPSVFMRVLHYFEWDDFRWYSVFNIVTIPFVLVLHLIIPWVEEKKYFRWLYVVHPVAILLFVFLSFQLWTERLIIKDVDLGYWFFWVLPFAILLSITIVFTTADGKKPIYNIVFVVVSMAMSVLCINTLAGEIVENLRILGVSWNISSAIMGLTVLGWGNSIGDFVSNILVAKAGSPQLALFACFSAPFTNLLVGLGAGFLYSAVRNGPIVLTTKGDHPDLNNVHYVGFIFILIGLAFVLIGIPAAKFRVPRWYGGVLLFIYVVFLLISLLISFKVIDIKYSLWDRNES